MSENKTDRKNVILGRAMRQSIILDLLKDGPVTCRQACDILGWPHDTAWPVMTSLYKLGKIRRESRRVALTREFVYTLRVDPEAVWAAILPKNAYAY